MAKKDSEKKLEKTKFKVVPMDLHPREKRGLIKRIGLALFEYDPPKLVESQPIFGEVDKVVRGKITKKINKILATAKNAKIGVTGDMWVRMDYIEEKSYRGKYKFVEEIYYSENGDTVADLEVEYIKKFLSLHPDKIDNKNATKVSKMTSYDGYFRIYLVYNKN